MTNKILLFQAHTSNLLGGGEFSLLALAEDSVRNGFNVHIIVPGKGPFSAAAQKIGAHTHIIDSYWWTKNGRNERNPRKSLRAIEKTQQLIRELNPYLCITNTITSPWLAYASHTLSVPHAWILREYGDTDHGLEFWAPKKEICKMVGELSVKVFANSTILRDHYKVMVGHKNIGIINPYVKKPQVINSVNPFKDNSLKLVCVGNLSKGKGQLDAVKATKILKDMGLNPQLFIIGIAAEIDYEKEIKEYINSESMEDYVVLSGYINNPADYVSYADFNLVCSRTETFGRVTIESLLLDTLVIGTNSANTQKILQNKDEILYNFGKPEELASKIADLNKKPSAYREKLVRDLKSTVEKLYSPEKVHKEFFDFVSSLDEGHKRVFTQKVYEPLMQLIMRQKQISFPEKAWKKLIFMAKRWLQKFGLRDNV